MTVRFEFRPDGYVRIRTWEACEGRERYVYEHQLVAIADGADPYKVFSDGRWHVHHCNRIRCDNRRENLELVDGDEHGEYHLHGREMNERGASA